MLFLVTVAQAADTLVPGTLDIDPPTLICIGVRWRVTGDDDGDATATLRAAPVSGGAWKAGLPVHRVRPGVVVGWAAVDSLAGSVCDLVPGTAYTVEIHAVDPDGLDQTETVEVTTRDVPADPAVPRVVSVTNARGLQTALNDALPGDVLTLAAGTYIGPFTTSESGTAANPIVIRGTGVDTILDGDGTAGNIVEIYGSYVHIESLTLQNGGRALRFQGAGARGNVVRYVTARDVGLGFASNTDQQDFYFGDNDLQGPLAWPQVYTDDNGAYSNVDGINLQGDGHVVCHNRLVGWGDAMKMGADGSRGVDFYGNDVREAYDNGLEFDGAEGNVRGFRNRFTNTFATLSFQPTRGGPAYAFRNVVVNVAHEQLKFHSLGGDEETVGNYVLHNSFVSAAHALNLEDSTTSHDFRIQGNLFLGPDTPAEGRAAYWGGDIANGLFDGNGWWPDGRYDFSDNGDWRSFALMQASGVFEANGVLLDGSPFAEGVVAPADYTTTMPVSDLVLAEDDPAVDAALVLDGVTDGYLGIAPDLGAMELGCAVPSYGPRPAGVDERDGTDPCAGGGSDTGTTDTGTTDSGTTDSGSGDTDTEDSGPTDGTDTDPGDLPEDSGVKPGAGCGCGAPGGGDPLDVGILLGAVVFLRRRGGGAPTPPNPAARSPGGGATQYATNPRPTAPKIS